MKEEFVEEHWKDFQQRYQGTFGWFEKSAGNQVLVSLVKITPEALSFNDKAGFKYTAHPDKGNIFTFLPVEKGVYLTEEHGVVYVSRIPQRQWKRGICIDNTSIHSLTTSQQCEVSFSLLESIFNQTPMLHVTENNRVFDRVFSTTRNKLFVYNKEIGSMDITSIVLQDRLFLQEVNDMVRNCHLPHMVTVA